MQSKLITSTSLNQEESSLDCLQWEGNVFLYIKINNFMNKCTNRYRDFNPYAKALLQ